MILKKLKEANSAFLELDFETGVRFLTMVCSDTERGLCGPWAWRQLVGD